MIPSTRMKGQQPKGEDAMKLNLTIVFAATIFDGRHYRSSGANRDQNRP